MHGFYETLLTDFVPVCRAHYGPKLVSVAVFGSVGRGTAGPDSDIDVLVVVEDSPDGRMARVDDFRTVERALGPRLAEARAVGLHTTFSPVIKTPHEAEVGGPLFLDMIEDAQVLYDRDGFIDGVLQGLRNRLERLGARRIWRGNAWFWDLKPDYRPGDVFEI